MTDLERSLRQFIGDLGGLEADFALVGGLAVSVRAEPRLTRDVDVVVSVPDDETAEEVIAQMRDQGYQPVTLLEHEVTGRLSAVRLTHQDRPEMVLDLLFAACGIEQEVVQKAETLEVLPEFYVPVAATGHLIAMKLLARDDRSRPADYDDLQSLVTGANEEDLSLAREAIELIAERGYARGRDLAGDLDGLER